MRTEQEMIAYALEIDVKLLDYIPDLFADLEELGSDAELIVEVLGAADLPQSAMVLDLGCGKGTVAVEVADELGFQVKGIDLFAPFIDSAKAAAVEAEVGRLCTFDVANVAEYVETGEPVDAVIFAALGDVLGPFDETIKLLRKCVKPGGYILVSDAYVKDGGSNAYPGFEGYGSHDEMVAWLTCAGDEIVEEVSYAQGLDNLDLDEAYEGYDEGELIRAQAEKIAAANPADAQALRDFVAAQIAEEAFIEENLEPVVWLIKRS